MSASNGKPIAWKSLLCGFVLLFVFAIACGGTSTPKGLYDEDRERLERVTFRGDYDRANRKILERVPRFPGAVEVIRQLEPHIPEGRGTAKPDGYGLRVNYRVDGATSVEALAKFCLENMDKTWERQATGPLVLFCKHESFIGIEAYYLALDNTFDVYVDYKYARDGRPTPC